MRPSGPTRIPKIFYIFLNFTCISLITNIKKILLGVFQQNGPFSHVGQGHRDLQSPKVQLPDLRRGCEWALFWPLGQHNSTLTCQVRECTPTSTLRGYLSHGTTTTKVVTGLGRVCLCTLCGTYLLRWNPLATPESGLRQALLIIFNLQYFFLISKDNFLLKARQYSRRAKSIFTYKKPIWDRRDGDWPIKIRGTCPAS